MRALFHDALLHRSKRDVHAGEVRGGWRSFRKSLDCGTALFHDALLHKDERHVPRGVYRREWVYSQERRGEGTVHYRAAFLYHQIGLVQHAKRRPSLLPPPLPMAPLVDAMIMVSTWEQM
jgi:hypothetical protein